MNFSLETIKRESLLIHILTPLPCIWIMMCTGFITGLPRLAVKIKTAVKKRQKGILYQHMRRFVVIILVCVLALAAGCSKKQVKPVPEGAVYFKNANKVIQALRSGYIAKDAAIIKSVSTDKGYNEIVPNLGKFDSAELTFAIKWVDVSTRDVTVNVQWEGVWAKGGKKDSRRGMAVFELTGQPLKFNTVLTGSPFIYPQQ